MRATPPPVATWKDSLHLFVCGLLMGVAELVPGISGGTVAFILGIYHNFIESIKTFDIYAVKLLFKGRVTAFLDAVAWKFLLIVLAGSAVSLSLLAKWFSFLLQHEIYRSWLYATFFGLIMASAIFYAKKVGTWTKRHVVACAFGFLFALFVTNVVSFVPEISTEKTFDVHVPLVVTGAHRVDNYDVEQEMLRGVTAATLNAMVAKNVITPDTPIFDPATSSYAKASDYVTQSYTRGIDPYLTACGALGVSAMLLPGMSGSYLLTILGAYPILVGALADFVDGLRSLSWNGEAFLVCVSVALGILLGGVLFSRVASYMFHHHRSLTIATMTGFVVGAIRCLWPFWSYHYTLAPLALQRGPQLHPLHPIVPDFSSATFWIACLFTASGFLIIALLEKGSRWMDRRPSPR